MRGHKGWLPTDLMLVTVGRERRLEGTGRGRGRKREKGRGREGASEGSRIEG
jgi:hypothetical protein